MAAYGHQPMVCNLSLFLSIRSNLDAFFSYNLITVLLLFNFYLEFVLLIDLFLLVFYVLFEIS